MAQELLREYYELCEGGFCQDLLTEEEKIMIKTSGVVFLTGIMQKCDQENGNGRVYSKKVLSREIENYQKIIEDRRALGELDHPDDSVVNLKNVSHMVTKMWWDGNNVMGKVKVLDTPSGNILKNLVKGGVKLGISSRGLGSTRKEGGKTIVEEDFQLICFDFVQEPSTPGAFMMSEGKRRDMNKVFSKTERLNRLLNDIIGK
jgi:hypothetical protein